MQAMGLGLNLHVVYSTPPPQHSHEQEPPNFPRITPHLATQARRDLGEDEAVEEGRGL